MYSITSTRKHPLKYPEEMKMKAQINSTHFGRIAVDLNLSTNNCSFIPSVVAN